MNQDNSNDDWQQRMYELEEKNGYQKLSSSEIEELKALHNKYCEINMKKEEKKEQKKEKQKQKEKINEIQKEINLRQYNLRIEKNIINEKKSDNIELIEKIGKLKGLSKEEIKKETDKAQILEDMSTMGTIMKEKIIHEKQTNPEKYFTNEEIIKNKSDEQTYALGIFSKVLENQGMVTAIEKDNSEDTNNNSATSMQFLVNGMSNKNKYDLYFDLGEESNNKLLNNEEERIKFHNKLRKKLAKECNINEEDIIITFPRKGSYQVTVIFKSEDFKLNEHELIKKFKKDKKENEKENEEDEKELRQLKKIEKGIILNGCLLNHNMLDYRGNNKDGGWAGKGEKRGGEEYIPPSGWTGYGLKVQDVYGDNTWLGMNNSEGEWCVAYHGVARGQDPKQVSEITGKIYKGGFLPSTGGKITYDPDLRHPGKLCGLGVYVSPDPSYAEGYAGVTEFNGEKYKCALMLRINPKKIRQSTTYPKEYILEPTTNEIRPYRILLKKC